MRLKLAFPALLILGLSSCGGDRGHYGTPSDPNEQQGNPNAKPENSIKSVQNGQADGDKAGKDPHTLTEDNTTGQAKKR